MDIETLNVQPFDATVEPEMKSFRWSNVTLVGLVATVLTLFVAGTSVALAEQSSISLMQTATVTRGAVLGGALRPGTKQAAAVLPAGLVRNSRGVRARAPTTNAAETRTHALKATNSEEVLLAETEFAALDDVPTVGSSQDASHWLYTGVVALGISSAAAIGALVQNNRNPEAHLRIAMFNVKGKKPEAAKGGSARGAQKAVGYKGSTIAGSAPVTRKGKPGYVYKLGTKNGLGNVDEYSPIWDPNVFKAGGDTYEAGLPGLLVWGAILTSILGVSAYLIYSTSQL